MKRKVRHILDVWGYYRFSTLLLSMVVFLLFAGLVCSLANGADTGRGPQPKVIDDQMAFPVFIR
jgi:hypothetical protein